MCRPVGLAFAQTERELFVADNMNHRVCVFDATGTFLRAFGARGTADGKLSHPAGVALDKDGTVWVADSANHRLCLFTRDGTFLRSFVTMPVPDDRVACLPLAAGKNSVSVTTPSTNTTATAAAATTTTTTTTTTTPSSSSNSSSTPVSELASAPTAAPVATSPNFFQEKAAVGPLATGTGTGSAAVSGYTLCSPVSLAFAYDGDVWRVVVTESDAHRVTVLMYAHGFSRHVLFSLVFFYVNISGYRPE